MALTREMEFEINANIRFVMLKATVAGNSYRFDKSRVKFIVDSVCSHYGTKAYNDDYERADKYAVMLPEI